MGFLSMLHAIVVELISGDLRAYCREGIVDVRVHEFIGLHTPLAYTTGAKFCPVLANHVLSNSDSSDQ